MPVIINEVEVLAEPSPSQASPAAQPATADASANQLRPLDIERLMAHVQARRLRLYAD